MAKIRLSQIESSAFKNSSYAGPSVYCTCISSLCLCLWNPWEQTYPKSETEGIIGPTKWTSFQQKRRLCIGEFGHSDLFSYIYDHFVMCVLTSCCIRLNIRFVGSMINSNKSSVVGSPWNFGTNAST